MSRSWCDPTGLGPRVGVRRFASAADRAWVAEREGAERLEEVWAPPLWRVAHDGLAERLAAGTDGLGRCTLSPGLVERVGEAVADGSYAPAPLRVTCIRTGNRERTIGIPNVLDQVVMAAWRRWAEPRLDRRLAAHVWGYRRGRGPRGAVRALGRVTVGAGATLVRADVRRLFESLDHRFLLDAAGPVWGGEAGARGPWWAFWRPAAPDPLALRLVAAWVATWSPGVGVPTGAAVSPGLANAYLGAVVDRWLVDALAAGRVAAAFRYGDDFGLVVPGPGEPVVAELAGVVGASRLRLHPDKTRVHRFDRAADWPARVLGIALRPRPEDGGWRLGVDPR